MTAPSAAASCGPCTLCCKVMGVEELAKPRDQWCSHCATGKGCRIYADRPPSCRDFECLWLRSQHEPGAPPMSLRLRPDRCHVVMTTTVQDTFQANVDPGYPGAWREGAIGALIESLVAARQVVIVGCGRQRVLLGSDGEVVDDFLADRAELEPKP